MNYGGIINEEWLNDNRNRKYPFLDSSSLEDSTKSMVLPNDLIVDLIFPVSAMDYDSAKFHLHQLVVFNGGIIITLGYDGSAIATRSITEAEHEENKSYYIEGLGNMSDSVGRISIGRFDSIKKYGGSYTFNSSNARLLPTVLRPAFKGVTALRIVSANNEESELLQGDLEIIAGSNIELTLISPPSGNKKIRISAVPSPDYESECDCPDTAQGECIKHINGVSPDEQGRFWIYSVGACLQLSTVSHGLRLTDNCSEPCCGCAELTVLRNELARLATQIATQRAFAQRALSNIEQMRDVVLSSKLGTIIPCS